LIGFLFGNRAVYPKRRKPMFISKIKIENFRSFSCAEIELTYGINVIIGHNNSGKTNLLKAIQLVFDRDLRGKPKIDDFSKEYVDFKEPPKIQITVTISEKNDRNDDKNVIYDWLINETPTYDAQLTYVFFLPSKHLEEYSKEVEVFKDVNGKYDQEKSFKLIEKKFIKKYFARIYGGNPEKEELADPENLNRFDFQFLDAIRDAEREMFFGNNTLLRDVLNYFLDYDLSNGRDFEELGKKPKKEIKKREDEFVDKSKKLLEHLIGRVSKEKIMEYSKETGADKGGKPDFDAEISEQEMLFALRLIVQKSGLKLPIKNNGLGYNNLLFIALILAKMQMERSSFMGDNAKVFPIMAIEEPEAHLHPSMQYKFLQFLDKNLNTHKQARQVFITSHSTHITSAVDLDSIICLYEDIDGVTKVGYPGKVFSNDKDSIASKIYVRRFLDATKSNMLFANRVIFVEGISEQLLFPCFALCIDKEEKLLDEHVCIVSVDSRTFKHFLKIFQYDPKIAPYAINKKVACITDADPIKNKKEPEGTNRRSWKKCYPFELDLEMEKYDYKAVSTHVKDLQELSESYGNIDVFTPPEGEGKTLEYELAMNNPSCNLLITGCFPSRGKNRKHFFNGLMQAYNDKKTLDQLKELCNHDEIIDLIDDSTWEETQKRKALIASIYYEAIENMKGEHAFYLERELRNNCSKGDEKQVFFVPKYISDSINYIIG
jgi:putative ATP-dependent endonuclease of the OLD family